MAKVFTTRPERVGQIRKPVELPPVPDALAEVARWPTNKMAALVFWKVRREFPEFAMTFTEADIKALADSLEYNKQEPKFVVTATARYVVFRVVDAATGDMLIATESNEADLDASERAKRLRRIKESVPGLVGAARSEMSQGITSQDTLDRLCDALMALAGQS